MDVNREEFLTDHWVRYPVVNEVVSDLADFVRGDHKVAYVGGRLSLDGHVWQLQSGGESLSFQFTSDASWLSRTLRNSMLAFSTNCLRSGDLVLLRISEKTGHGFLVDQVALLFAADDPKWQSRAKSLGEFSVSFSDKTAAAWEKTMALIREFFKTRGFREMQTPTLVSSPGTEPFLNPFVTEVAYGRLKAQTFLPTSPEFHLKKLLSAGWTRIFELKTCFRNEEGGHHHQPEFTMLEWYRAFANLDAIAADSENLIRFVSEGLDLKQKDIRLKRVTIGELFSRFLDFQLQATTTIDELQTLASRFEIDWQKSDAWDDVFFRIFLTKLEPELAKDGPWLVHGYPPSQAALSRLTSEGWADRFEIYWRGFEIANAFHELNDPEINQQRFEADLQARKLAGKLDVPIDQELMRALYKGMPPSGGIALGVDRLFMAMLEMDSIEETRAFPFRTES